MKASLQLKMGQNLAMTPQLQQAIRLLQLSNLELQQELTQAAEENPLLDIEENTVETTPWDMSSQAGWQVKYKTNNLDDEDYDLQTRLTPSISLQAHLTQQMQLKHLNQLEQYIAMVLIDALDDDGYLRTSLDEVKTTLAPTAYAETDEIEVVLHLLQHCEPAGIGARDLTECLLLQLRHFPHTPDIILAKEWVTNNLDWLAKKQYSALMRHYHLDEERCQGVMQLILSLNPKPGFNASPGDISSQQETQYIVPDVLVRKIQGVWHAELNPYTMPKVGINEHYAQLVRHQQTSQDNQYLRQHLQEARWLIKSLESRNDTLMKVTRAIIAEQADFLEQGEEAMKPMVLYDIAQAIDMHESTISRVTTQKFMATPRGVYELKYFFSSHVATQAGGECSSTAIRALIKKLILTESPNKPLSDQQVANFLQEQGIQVARRTVAKYRETLQILPSSERRQRR